MKERFRINPILKKELQISSRSVKIPMVIMGYNLLLAMIAIIAIAITNGTALSYSYDYSSLHTIFPFIVCAEIGMISLFVAVITGSSISGEREKQTLDVMLTTPMTPLSIAIGKMSSVIVKIMMFVVSSIPILSISFVLGGMSWLALLEFVGITVFMCIYVGSIGVFCSSLVKKSMMAALLTILIGTAISVLTIVILIVAAAFYSMLLSRNLTVTIGAWPLVLLFNPYSVILDFIARVMNADGIYGLFSTDLSNDIPGYVIALSRFWTVISITVNMGIASIFMWLSTRIIGSVRSGK